MELVMSDTTGDALALPTATPASTPERLPDGRFAPGSHANPFGRPRGSRNRTTLDMIHVLESKGEAISNKLTELALAGDKTALRLCVERLIPRRKSVPLNLDLAPINTPTDVSAAISAVVDATMCGEIDTDQARSVSALIEVKRKSLETIELEDRLTLIEKKVSRDRRAI